MDVSLISLIVAIIALLLAAVAFYQAKDSKDEGAGEISFTTKPLQLQAYERLVLLCERISLPSLISRVNQPGLSSKEMQVFLLESIKQEFEYNISQQVYVSQAAWDAVRNLRDQNMLMINSISKTLPPDAAAVDLNKRILDMIMKEENAALHTIALETLNSEAKKLMK